MECKVSRKKKLLFCIILILLSFGMDMRFYAGYVLNKSDYRLCDAKISQIGYKSIGKTGAYKSEIEYSIDNDTYCSSIRTAIGDKVGSKIKIAVKKDDYSKAVRSYFYFERKTWVHSIFMGWVIIYFFYLLVIMGKEKFTKKI